jgi:uncharacterized protein DUF1573
VKRALPFLVALSLVAPLLAEDAKKPSADKEAKATPGSEAKSPRITVEPASFDFGRTLQNKTLVKEFVIKNFGDADLVIENVSTTCGCTVAEGYAKLIKPGGTTPLRVSLETRSSNGKMERKVLVRSNDPATGLLEVKVEATVEPAGK